MMPSMSMRMSALSVMRILCLGTIMHPGAVLRAVTEFTGLMLDTAAVAAVLMHTLDPTAGNRASCCPCAARATGQRRHRNGTHTKRCQAGKQFPSQLANPPFKHDLFLLLYSPPTYKASGLFLCYRSLRSRQQAKIHAKSPAAMDVCRLFHAFLRSAQKMRRST